MSHLSRTSFRPSRVACLALACVVAAPVARAAEPAPSAEKPAAAAPAGGWQANPKQVADSEKRRKGILYREEGVPQYALPDVLSAPGGGAKAATAQEWEQKVRPQVLEAFRTHMYGKSPAAPKEVKFDVVATDPKALDGKATLKRVKITSVGEGGKSYAFEAAVLIPNGAKKPVPAFVLINNRGVDSADPSRQKKDGFWPAEEIIDRGYATAVFRTNDVDPDKKDEAARKDGVRGVWPDGAGKAGEDGWATIAAWAWGASRVLDYLQQDPAIDGSRVAVVGHSRGGKTALWAGAEDPRFAIAISNDSGAGGAALSRRRFGETVKVINTSFPYWFAGNFKKFNDREDELPIDQHQLVALMAPRAVYVASADTDLWADPRGEYLSIAHAGPVFKLYGQEALDPAKMPPLDTPVIAGKTGYHIRQGGHNLTPYDWQRYMDFADKLWGRK